MKLLALDKMRGWARLAITNNMDLVNLYRLVRPGDVVYQETSREVKKERASGEVDSERVSLKVGINVEKKSADPLMKRIRFQGKIVFTDRDLDILKKYHTIQVSRGDVVEIESRERLPYLMRLGEEGEERVEEIVAISGDDEELALVKIDVDGIKVLKTWRLDGASKRLGYNVETEREKVFDELVHHLKELTSKSKPRLILMGTTVHIDVIASDIRKRDVGISNLIAKKIPVNVGGVDGIREALRRGVLGENLKPLADAIQVERVMRTILKHPEHVHMGLEEVARACRTTRGAIVLADEDFIWENIDNSLLDEILSRAERGIIKFRTVLSDTEASDKIKSLGGIVCLEKMVLEK